MRELERESSEDDPDCHRLAIVGRGRLGTALASAFTDAGYPVVGPLGRDAEQQLVGPFGRDAGQELIGPPGRHSDGACVDAVLLCVPDAEIAPAAALIPRGPLVGHCSGATGLDVLGDHEAFSLHPLMTVTAAGACFAGAGAASGGSTPRARGLARELAAALGMQPVEIETEDRAAYHAAASIASNFLVTLEAAAERLAASAGVDRELLVPLVRATVENWAASGARRALTGPVARGDDATVRRQRLAVAERAPDLLPLFDALTDATRELARQDPVLA
jgi:predicted short-subunit dehydrogenase-like oxidoreductase (DUF2520 family)